MITKMALQKVKLSSFIYKYNGKKVSSIRKLSFTIIGLIRQKFNDGEKKFPSTRNCKEQVTLATV